MYTQPLSLAMHSIILRGRQEPSTKIMEGVLLQEAQDDSRRHRTGGDADAENTARSQLVQSQNP